MSEKVLKKILDTLRFYASDQTYDARSGMIIFKDSGEMAKQAIKLLTGEENECE